MQHVQRESGNDVCYLDGRQGVARRLRAASHDPSPRPHHANTDESRWLRVDADRSFAVLVVLVLVALGLANVVDVLALARGRGRRALVGARRRRDRHRSRAGVGRRPRPAFSAATCWWPSTARRSSARPTSSNISIEADEGTRLPYTLVRLGDRSRRSSVSLAPAPRGSSMYFVLAAVGLFTLLVGASVRLRRPRDQATLHFFWLCVAFFGVFTFSFNGRSIGSTGCSTGATRSRSRCCRRCCCISRWSSRSGRAAGRASRCRRDSARAADVHARRSCSRRARIVAVARGASDGPRPVLAHARLARSRRAGVSVRLRGRGARRCWSARFSEITSVTAAVSCAGSRGARRSASVRSRSATRCRGRSASNPPLALQLTAIPLGLVPLTFASAIVRYRLRDVEVIIKRGLAYTAFLARQRRALRRRCSRSIGFVFANDADEHNWIVALLATHGRRAAGAAGEGRGAERARPRVLPRSLRLPPRAGRASRAT